MVRNAEFEGTVHTSPSVGMLPFPAMCTTYLFRTSVSNTSFVIVRGVADPATRVSASVTPVASTRCKRVTDALVAVPSHWGVSTLPTTRMLIFAPHTYGLVAGTKFR